MKCYICGKETDEQYAYNAKRIPMHFRCGNAFMTLPASEPEPMLQPEPPPAEPNDYFFIPYHTGEPSP